MPDRTGSWKTVAIASSAALLAALLGSLVGGVIAYQAALDSAEHQASEARIADERDIRRQTYLAYLDHANEYWIATSDLFGRAAEGGEAGLGATAAFQTWLTARSDYQGSINSVYVYGSDEAWERHLATAKALPSSVGSISPGQAVNELADHPDQQVSFGEAYNNFLDLMCQELPAAPREGCEP